MITITEQAAAQIQRAAAQSGAAGMRLRIAVKRTPEGKLDYAMGFDEAHSGDEQVTSAGIDVVVSAESKALAGGLTLDYVEFAPGDFRFIFINPNDPEHAPPQEPST